MYRNFEFEKRIDQNFITHNLHQGKEYCIWKKKKLLKQYQNELYMNILWLLLGGSPFFGWWWLVVVGGGWWQIYFGWWRVVVGGGIVQPNPLLNSLGYRFSPGAT